MIVVGTVHHGHLSGEFCDIVGVALMPGWQVLEIILHRVVVDAELAVHDDVESLGRGSDSVLFHSEKDGVHDGILHVGPAVVLGLSHIASPELQLVGDGVVPEVVVGLQPLHDVLVDASFFVFPLGISQLQHPWLSVWLYTQSITCCVPSCAAYSFVIHCSTSSFLAP